MDTCVLRLLLASVEDARRLGYDLDIIARMAEARRSQPAARRVPLDELYIDMLLGREMERVSLYEALVATARHGRAA